MSRSAEELHLSAVDLLNRGRVAAAKRALAAAAAAVAADDVNLRARIAGTLSYALARTGDMAEALRLCVEALALDGLDAHTAAIVAGQMGALEEQSGQLDSAVRWLSTGIAGLADDPVAEANLRMTRSVIAMRRRDLRAAAEDNERAHAAFARAAMIDGEAMTQHNLGYIALLQGDLVPALARMSQARTLIAGFSAVAAATSDVDRAEVLRDAGLTTEAEHILAASARVFGANRMRQARAEAELNLARSQLTHDPAAAMRTAAAAARRFRAVGNETLAARADGVRVRAAFAERLDSDAQAARRPLPDESDVESVAAALDAAGLRGEAVAVRLAGALRTVRRGDGASRSVRVPPNSPVELRLLARQVRAARAEAEGRERDIRRHAAAGIDELTRWQASFGSLDLQASVAMHGQPLMLAGLSSALRSGRPSVLFEWSERARHASQRIVPLRPPPDPEAATELAELRALRAQDGGDWLASRRATELHDRVRERQWTTTGVVGVDERVSLDELRAALDDDTALLAYVWSEGVLACLVVTAFRARIVGLPGWSAARQALGGLRADLDVSASVRSGPIADVVRRALRARLATLSAHLLEPALAVAGGTSRVVLTTPGALAGIPWSMLPAMRGRPFTVAASASKWVHARAAPTPARRAGIAVGPSVPRGAEEADVVAAAWRGTDRRATVLAREAASVDAVSALAADVDVLHIAAHGRHASDNPLFSGLELADGALFGYDIDRIPRLPATVVLSACEVGRSSVRWGEEALGMTRTWLHAGSRCVVAAPVVVADDEACELLGAMHDGLAAGRDPAAALVAAAESVGVVAPFQCHGSGF